jgi:hypothetical protein
VADEVTRLEYRVQNVLELARSWPLSWPAAPSEAA